MCNIYSRKGTDVLSGKTVLLTGLTGRVGGAIANRFAGTCDLWGLARYTPSGSLEAARKLGVTPVRGDYASGDLSAVPTDFDYVLHVAVDNHPQNAQMAMAANSDGPALLMGHCRSAKAFLHVSSTGVYAQNTDRYHAYKEADDVGGTFGGQYTPSKLSGEGAVRAAALLLNLPTVICRQNVQYGGAQADGGLIDHFLDVFVKTGEAFLPPEGPLIIGPIHEDDIYDLVEPSLAIAAIPPEIVNWSGDDLVDWQELFEYVDRLTGKRPAFKRVADFDFPSCYPDPTRRREIAGPSSRLEGGGASLARPSSSRN